MAKTFDKAVTGFNHNIKHKGKVYHVQTEDSGVNNPHVITHLFVGGNILASKKTSYADIATSPNLAELVREMMEEQHKEMLRNLVNGMYNNLETAHSRHYQPGQLASEKEAKAAQDAAKQAPPPRPSTPTVIPPEVLAARAMTEQPKQNDVGVETLFGEDLISEKSLDEVILGYLAGQGDN